MSPARATAPAGGWTRPGRRELDPREGQEVSRQILGAVDDQPIASAGRQRRLWRDEREPAAFGGDDANRLGSVRPAEGDGGLADGVDTKRLGEAKPDHAVVGNIHSP